MSGARPPFPSYAFMARIEKSITTKLRVFYSPPESLRPNLLFRIFRIQIGSGRKAVASRVTITAVKESITNTTC